MSFVTQEELRAVLVAMRDGFDVSVESGMFIRRVDGIVAGLKRLDEFQSTGSTVESASPEPVISPPRSGDGSDSGEGAGAAKHDANDAPRNAVAARNETAPTGRPLPAPSPSHHALSAWRDEAARIEVGRTAPRGSCLDAYDALVNASEKLAAGFESVVRERDDLRDSVEHWSVKAECYGNMVHGCSPVLQRAGFPVDGTRIDGGVGGVGRSVKALAQDRDTWRSRSESAETSLRTERAKVERARALVRDARGLIERFVARHTKIGLVETLAPLLNDARAFLSSTSPESPATNDGGKARCDTAPRNGSCCSCGYSGDAEGTCPKRDDSTHCVHWWEEPDGTGRSKGGAS